ncbi:thioredoxin domain-containing protein 17-like [Vanessa cardui]|uniref:thioredoxin domain-containing protein 17-like n=1 Tax=Vanessa cardui TaxID=171605 RepID=UPI001F147AF6|nr:thioredoxin domain-containing protein 17-like [Vanessa cardui]XP_046965353.1 thioredoxin domain-containing protein 17-like [Vanessa cardui]
MVTIANIKGFEEFVKYTETIDDNGPQVLFYFSGSKLPNGNSWCPDCAVAEPMVRAFLNELNKNIIFVFVDVGDREYWKDRACPFRTDTRSKLLVIPTIIKWKGVQRLEGSQCGQRDLLQMLFEDED